MCANCGSEPSVHSMGPLHHPAPSHPSPPSPHLLAGRRKLLFMSTHRSYRRLLLDFVSRFFQGQKPGLTDVQAELDRMTRKQDSMVSANNIPPPTGNEAWRQQQKNKNKQLRRPLHYYSGKKYTCTLRAYKIDQIPKVCHCRQQSGCRQNWVSDAIRYFGVLARQEERERERGMKMLMRWWWRVLKALLYFCPLFHCKCSFVRGVGFKESRTHQLAAGLVCWAAAPPPLLSLALWGRRTPSSWV